MKADGPAGSMKSPRTRGAGARIEYGFEGRFGIHNPVKMDTFVGDSRWGKW